MGIINPYGLVGEAMTRARRRLREDGRWDGGQGYDPGPNEAPMLWVLDIGEDDPRKCTAKRLSRDGLVERIEDKHRVPAGAIMLSPFSETPVMRMDGGASHLAAVDCSWRTIKGSAFPKKGVPRRLPLMVAANPISFGKLMRLSTAEAIAAALFIMGHRDRCQRIMGRFRFGETFLQLNKEPLEAYAACTSMDEIEAEEDSFFPPVDEEE